MKNAFYFGDNLHVLREYIADESVDLIYLDPPFNSNATYNLLFKSPDRKRWSDAQIATFEDTWSWGELADAQFREITSSGGKASEVLTALRRILGENDMLAYLTMMTARLVELHRTLKPNGCIYLHCDPTASHYLKVLLDAIFGAARFHNEIVWKRTSSHGNVSANYGDVTDTILYFSKGSTPRWNKPYVPLSDENIAKKYTYTDPDGRRFTTRDLRNPADRPNLKYEYRGYQPHPNGWSISRELMEQYDAQGRLYFPKDPSGRIRLKLYLDESPGRAIHNLWDDIPPLNSQARERLGYPTQKPVALLERILGASSDPEDVILDPFCGCGTTLHAAQNLGRRWIGIDVAVQAMQIVGDRLRSAFPSIEFDVFGLPTSPEGAHWLAAKDPFKFEEWAVSRVGAMHSGRYRNDGGIDGYFYFMHGRDEHSRGIVSVKAGRNINPGMVRDLTGTLFRERTMNRDPSAIAVLLCAREPTDGMIQEARRAGTIQTMYGEIPAVQILSVADIFAGKTIQVPLMFDSVSAAAAGRRKGKATSGYLDPREIFRQRQMLFSFHGAGRSVQPDQAVMPEPLRSAG
ncbi:site-specific DNA-methyltransferase [Cereibacter azotoformans]|uniref:site-specific DNA-methyltransferase (adenine-specific) n=1 Tax=Cereibacter azotoformans TaxID=43057 RepID=A0A2T5JSJ0_9RHOB|nr:site-specific DNA-methyltransferase [Cereibacter azotoformans]PTR11167.1 site-specific DNA-methyltransferase (adenine-specific) [Cereibacter azotoformans]